MHQKYLYFKIEQNKSKGFTIVELIVYLGILVLMLVAVVQSVVLLTSSYRNVKAIRDIEVSGMYIMDRMTRDIRSADSVSTIDSVFNTSPGTVVVSATDSTTGGSTTTKFTVENNMLHVYRNTTLLGPLNRQSTTVTNLAFRRIVTPVSSAIKIELTLSAASTTSPISKNFYNTIVLRGSY
jgi:type II secretory pathway pseudopilin PulG